MTPARERLGMVRPTSGDRIDVTTDDRTVTGTVVDTTTSYITTDGGDGTHKADVVSFDRDDGHRMKVFDHDAASEYDDAVDLYTTRGGVGNGPKAIVATDVDVTVTAVDDGFTPTDDVDLRDVDAGDTVEFRTSDGVTRSRTVAVVDTDRHDRTTVAFDDPADTRIRDSFKACERIDQVDGPGGVTYMEGDIAEPEYDMFGVVGIRVPEPGVVTDGGDDIIVADDDGVILDDTCGERGPNGERCARDAGHAGPHAAGFPEDAGRRPDPEPRRVWDDRVDPDDEGVEILSDGGVPYRDHDGPVCRDCGTPIHRPDTTTKCEACGTIDPDGIAVSIADFERDDRRCDGGRPPLSTHPGPPDVDPCRDCGRYAPHPFDHDPACPQFRPIDHEPDVTDTPSPATNGGMEHSPTDRSPEALASRIVAADVGDRAIVHADGGRGKVLIYDGDVVATDYHRAVGGVGGTHVVTIDVPDRHGHVAVQFDRDVDRDRMAVTEPSPVVYDPERDAQLAVTGFAVADE
jgi:hypothetical protein